MKITICYDNTAVDKHLTADWGFACYIEVRDKRILFDTGGNGELLLDNMRLLGIDPKAPSDIFISHPDFDHIGGLCHILNQNKDAILHNPLSFRGVKYANQVFYYDAPAMIYENIYTTGELDRVEQSLAVRTDLGWVIVIGCAHPGVGKIMKAVLSIDGSIPVYALVGGLHGFNEFPLLQKVSKVCPTHCTMHIDEIRDLYPEKYIRGGVGAVLDF